MYVRAPNTGPISVRSAARRAAKTRRSRRLKVFDVRASSPELEFVLLDLNAAGMRIETVEPLRVGARITVDFERHGSRATIAGDVKWCRLHRTLRTGPDDFCSLYRAGFSFQEADNIGDLSTIFA